MEVNIHAILHHLILKYRSIFVFKLHIGIFFSKKIFLWIVLVFLKKQMGILEDKILFLLEFTQVQVNTSLFFFTACSIYSTTKEKIWAYYLI